MTPDGRRALGRLRAHPRQIEDDLLGPLDERQRQQLHTLILRLSQHHLPNCGENVPPREPG
jgi:hypothetical protein